MTEISKEQMLHRLKVLRIYCRGNHFECGACKLDVECDAIEALIESSVKITTVGGGLFSHYPQGRAKQTEGSESSGEQPVPPIRHYCQYCEGGSLGGETCPACLGTGTGLKPAPPAIKESLTIEPEVDNSGHLQAEERRETARAVKEAFASQREWADKWRGQDNPALEPKSDSYYETVRDRAVALILSPPAKEGVSVTSEEITSLANDLAKDTWLGRCQILEKWLRSIGIRVVEPSEAAEGEPEGGGE